MRLLKSIDNVLISFFLVVGFYLAPNLAVADDSKFGFNTQYLLPKPVITNWLGKRTGSFGSMLVQSNVLNQGGGYTHKQFDSSLSGRMLAILFNDGIRLFANPQATFVPSLDKGWFLQRHESQLIFQYRF